MPGATVPRDLNARTKLGTVVPRHSVLRYDSRAASCQPRDDDRKSDDGLLAPVDRLVAGFFG